MSERKLRPGVVYNPFIHWPRNLSCFCGSGEKFKKCHESKLQMGCSEHEYKVLKPDFDKILSHVERLHDSGVTYKLQKPAL